MEVFIALAGAVVVGIVAWRAYEHTKTRAHLRALASGAAPIVAGADVEGHSTHGGWHFFARADEDERYERWAYRATVQDILPDWLMMDWWVGRAEARGGSRTFLPEALFGREALEDLPAGWRVIADAGDLVVQSDERYLLRVPSAPLEEVDAAARRLARRFLEGGTEALRAALAEAVDVQGEAEALRLLCLRFPDAPETRALVQGALTHEIAAVRVVAARALGADGHAVLAETAHDDELPADVRREACRALARRGDHEALLDVALTAPGGVEDVLAEALADVPDPRVEGAVLPMLDHGSEVVAEAAAHALAQRGSAACVPALEARLATRPGPGLKAALRVALDLIRGRAVEGRGGLSLADDGADPPEVGQVSLPPKPRGELSDPEA